MKRSTLNEYKGELVKVRFHDFEGEITIVKGKLDKIEQNDITIDHVDGFTIVKINKIINLDMLKPEDIK